MNFIFFFILIIIIILLIYFHNRKSIIVKNYNSYSLGNDGFQFMPGLLSPSLVNNIKKCERNGDYKVMKDQITHSDCLKTKLMGRTGDGYIFQNYMLVIKKSSIHTCHRDSNGTLFNPTLNHPTYTLLIFLETMERSLGLIPKSHMELNSYYVNIMNNTIAFSCKPGDALLFNSNLYHVGEINAKPNNLRLQFKLCHFSDEKKIDYYNNYFKILNQDNHYPQWLQQIQKNISCFIPGISNLSQYQIQTDSDQDKQSTISKIFSQILYGNSEFYKLESIDLPHL